MARSKQMLKSMIKAAMLQERCDIVIRNSRIVDVCNHQIVSGKSILIKGGCIVGFADNDYQDANQIIDARGQFAMPGFINAHVHIESSHLSMDQFAKAVIPFGTTTVIADPHEICNVCGLDGLDYLYEASEKTPLSVFFMIPSCVPATHFEHSGAEIKAADIESRMNLERVLGLGELMDYVGVINASDDILDKIAVAEKHNKVIDGHSPLLKGNSLDAYIVSGAMTDHECATPEELRERTSKGMYVLLRQGSACHDTAKLSKGVDEYNSRFCLFCTDDRQPGSIFAEGDINNNVRIAIENGINPITAIQMASLNAATAHNLRDRGSITPGKRADIILSKSISKPVPSCVLIGGKVVARDGEYLVDTISVESDKVMGKVNIGLFRKSDIALKLNSKKVHVIKVNPGSVVTDDVIEEVETDEKGRFVCSQDKDIVKIAVIERHKGTGNVGVGLLTGYGLKRGAIALSIAHDSHNLIVVGRNDDDMFAAIKELESIRGGIALVNEGRVIKSLPHEIAGLMTAKRGLLDLSHELDEINRIAVDELGVSPDVEPVMTLCFMALPVIPSLKITDNGLFDVIRFKPIPVEA